MQSQNIGHLKQMKTDRQGGISQNLPMLTIIVSILNALASIGLLLLYLSQPAWQLGVLVIFYAASAGTGIYAYYHLYPGNKYYTGIILIGVVFGLTTIASSALLSGIGLPAAITFLIFTLVFSSAFSESRWGNLAAGLGIVISGVSAILSDFSPVPQQSIRLVSVLTPAILGILFIIYVTLLVIQSVTATMRVRLVTIFLAIVIIPLAILSIFQAQFMFNVLSDETSQLLRISAQQTAMGMDEFITSAKLSVAATARSEVFTRYLELPAAQRKRSSEERQAQQALIALDAYQNSSKENLTSYALLDMDGTNIFDTLIDNEANPVNAVSLLAMGIDPEKIRQGNRPVETEQDYFLVPARSGVPYVSPLLLPNSTRGFFFISAPVMNAKKQVIGVLLLRYDSNVLQQQLLKRINLIGESSYPILLDENNIRLADTFTPQYIYKAVAPLSDTEIKLLKSTRRLPNLPDQMLYTNFVEFSQILKNNSDQTIFSTDISSPYESIQAKEIGSIARMSSMPWKVVYLITNYSDQALRSEQRRLTTLITTILAVLIGLIALGAAHFLSAPIIQLTRTALRISEGDLEAQVPMQSADEFGSLGRAFNSMTSQLRALINELEERVKARTQEIETQNVKLSYRARQLETVAQVAHQIVSAQELEKLLSSITQLISERFNFYHVGIFLVDSTKETAILRAANSPGGQRMLARQHQLPVGKRGIVGYVTATGEARIASDVGADAVFFNNPDLPETRSEMALPLRIGDQIIGAIDIQSTQPNAFQNEDIELFTTLADQVAIAIQNNTLFLETLKALEEAQNLHRRYLQSEWVKDVTQRKVLGYLYNQNGISPQRVENPLWEKVFRTGETSCEVHSGGGGEPDQAAMAVPISLRGQTIGVIQVQDQGIERTWSEDEIAVVNSIASQVAIALENARLFENTVRRAEREKKVLQITARIRSTNDPEEMMRIAISELQNSLGATRTQIYVRQPGQDRDENMADLDPIRPKE
jgi:GAF domain-containing protein/HAMP domain-containing protein